MAARYLAPDPASELESRSVAAQTRKTCAGAGAATRDGWSEPAGRMLPANEVATRYTLPLSATWSVPHPKLTAFWPSG